MKAFIEIILASAIVLAVAVAVMPGKADQELEVIASAYQRSAAREPEWKALTLQTPVKWETVTFRIYYRRPPPPAAVEMDTRRLAAGFVEKLSAEQKKTVSLAVHAYGESGAGTVTYGRAVYDRITNTVNFKEP